MIVLLILHALFCVFFAYVNAKDIKEGAKIHHGLNGAIFLTIAGFGAFIHWTVPIVILCNTRVIFDISLNLFRGLGIDYVSPNPKSIVDKAEKWIFGNSGLVPKILYTLISIILLCL